jgi:hypothetical protein
LLAKYLNLKVSYATYIEQKESVSSYIVVDHVTRSQNEYGLSKYLMVHEQLCSIRDLYLAMSIKVSDTNQISRGNALLVGGKSS